ARLGLDDLPRHEPDRLQVSRRAGRFEPGLLEAIGDVRGGLLVTFAAGVAPFERVVREELDVRPPALRFGTRLLRRAVIRHERRHGHRGRKGHNSHVLFPRQSVNLERTESVDSLVLVVTLAGNRRIQWYPALVTGS